MSKVVWHFKTKVSCSSKQNWESVFFCECLIPQSFVFIFVLGTKFKLFSLPRNSWERNFTSLLLFLFHGTEFWAFFSFTEWFGTEFLKFSVLLNSWNSFRTNHLFLLFRLLRNFFAWNSQPYTQTITENNKFVNIKCASTNIFRDQQNSVAMEPLHHMTCLSEASSPTRFVPASKYPRHEIIYYYST